jgi:hypothetical protein
LTLTKGHLRLYLGALLILQVITCTRLFHFALQGQIDFRTFYATGHMLRSGDAIYEYAAENSAQSALVSPNAYALPFLLPPYAALLFVPFSLFSYHTGYFIFFAVNLGFCALALYLMRPFTATLDALWRPATTVLFLSFLPLGIALVFGQVSLLLLLLYCACFVALQSGKPILSGVLLAVALIKFQVALPITLLFLIWRQWRFLAGFLLGAFGLALVSLRVTGAKVLEIYLHSLFTMSQQSSGAAVQPSYGMFPAQMPNLYGFLHTISGGATWALVLAVVLSLLALLWAATQKPSLPLALLAGLFVSYHLYLYDLTLLLLPMSLIFNASLDTPLQGRRKGALYVSIFLALATFWSSFINFDHHYLVALPVATLFLLSPDFFPVLPSRQAG